MSAQTVAVNAAKPDPDGSVLVRWRLDPGRCHRAGAFRIRGLDDRSDPAVAAELIALAILLVEREAAGLNRTGAGLTLTVSRGAVRKLARGRSARRDLVPLARFLWTRFAEADLRVVKHPDWLAETPIEPEPVDATARSGGVGDRIEALDLGPSGSPATPSSGTGPAPGSDRTARPGAGCGNGWPGPSRRSSSRWGSESASG